MLRSLTAVATISALLATGCASGPDWPSRPVALSTQFALRGEATTIDVLPLDLQLWAEPGYAVDLDELRDRSELQLTNTLLEALGQRRYAIGGMIGWDGKLLDGRQVLAPDDVAMTTRALAHYGAAAAAQPGRLPPPFLPARLGAATGADATLYVGGWGYVAEKRDDGSDVGEAIVIGLMVITVVALVAVLLSDSGKSHSKAHGGKAHGGGNAPAGKLPSGGGKHVGVALHGGSHAVSAGRVLARTTGAMLRTVDVFGRVALDAALSAPDWADDPALPREGAGSRMYLEMTLVDNRTGLTLWHARQLFPASAEQPQDLARVARTMLQALPARSLRAAPPVLAPPTISPPAAEPVAPPIVEPAISEGATTAAAPAN